MDSAFPIPSRFVILIWIIPFIYLPGAEPLYLYLNSNSTWYWFDTLYYFYAQMVFAFLMAYLVILYKVNWRLMLNKANKSEYIPAIKLTAFLFFFSIAAAYALFYPLSFIYPEFVNYWFIESPPVIFGDPQLFPILPNILSFLSLVILAPVVEEFAFRGLLLHRWSAKWGMTTAIIASSLLFGILHPDPIGATAFGIAMCILYLKTQTLIVPMVCHALNNFVVWLIQLGYIIESGSEYVYTLQDFHSEWGIGLVCAIISIIWIYYYLRSKPSQRAWRLPNL